MHYQDNKRKEGKALAEKTYKLAFQYERASLLLAVHCGGPSGDFSDKRDGIFLASFALGGGLANTI